MKRIFAILLTAVLLSLSGSFTLAAESPVASLPAFDVTLNGVKVENDNRQFPLIVYNDITYFPMTYYDCRFLGLTTKWEDSTDTLSIEQSEITCAYRDYASEMVYPEKFFVPICRFKIYINGKAVNNSDEEYPLLLFKNVTYFPLTWRFAKEEFGWDYSFTPENGLVINSHNAKTEALDLPNSKGTVALDDTYCYYNGSDGTKNYVYRTPISDTSKCEIIHEIPDTNLSTAASFVSSEDGVYITYHAGTSPVMSTKYYYKINSDGTLTHGYPDKYTYGNHGYTETGVRKSDIGVEKYDISVKAVNDYPDSETEITYIKNGTEHKMPDLPGHISFGRCMIDGKEFFRISSYDLIKIHGEKIYFSAYDYEEKSGTNNLYVLDTVTNQAKVLIKGIEGAFHVCSGWSNELRGDTVMIIFGKDGKLMRYTEKDNAVKEIGNTPASDETLILEAAVGAQTVYTLQKSIDGSKTIVSVYDDYASGYGSISGTIFTTSTGTNHAIYGDKLAVFTVGEASDDSIRMTVLPWGNGHVGFRTSDAVSNVFVNGDSLICRTNDGLVVKADVR